MRAPGQVKDMKEIEQIIVGHNEGVPVFIRDVAEVIVGGELRTGAATSNGQESVVGTVFMLLGENSRNVAQRVSKKMEELYYHGVVHIDIFGIRVYGNTLCGPIITI